MIANVTFIRNAATMTGAANFTAKTKSMTVSVIKTSYSGCENASVQSEMYDNSIALPGAHSDVR